MKWIAGLFTSAFDEFRFRLGDRQARRLEMSAAERAFPTDDLETALTDARKRLEAELDQRFDAPMRAHRASLAALRVKVAKLDADCADLVCDHKGGLDAAYAKREDLKSQMESAKKSVREAYAETEHAKKSISSWHGRSRSRIPIYGKRGKPIPERSLFFFSHSDLDSAKRDASRASSKINDTKCARDRVWAELQKCGNTIAELKESRKRRRALIGAGQTRTKVLGERSTLLGEIRRVSEAEIQMKSLRAEYTTTGAIALEIASIVERIKVARIERAERLRAFDSRDARAGRREQAIRPNQMSVARGPSSSKAERPGRT